MHLEKKILKIIRGEQKAPLIAPCLVFSSFFYRFALALRNFAYDRKILSSKALPIPVVSIGNIASGGTGKTPLIHLLSQTLEEKVPFAILSRGYRSSIEKSHGVLQVSKGKGPLCSAEKCGDEPFFLAHKTRASVWAGVDRILSGKLAIKSGARCLLLDDGMQHRRLKRDFEIILIDGISPLCEQKFLPSGFLRDSPKQLKRADLIAISHIRDKEHFHKVEALLSKYSQAPKVGVQVEVCDPQRFTPQKVGVFCGIGRPERFLQTVRDLNQQIVDTLILNDHESPAIETLDAFAKRCADKGAKALLCTEKDIVKLQLQTPISLPLIPIEIGLKIVHGKEHWDQLIANILDKVSP